MPVTETPHAPRRESLSLTIDQTDEGWWAARVEGTGAFGQGRTRDEALENVASALYDLSHLPTRGERVWFRARALWADLRDVLPAR